MPNKKQNGNLQYRDDAEKLLAILREIRAEIKHMSDPFWKRKNEVVQDCYIALVQQPRIIDKKTRNHNIKYANETIISTRKHMKTSRGNISASSFGL